MTQSWKVTLHAPRPVIEAALLAHEDAWDWDPDMVLSGSEVAEDRPDDWRLEVWLPRKPTKADTAAILALFAGPAPKLEIEQLPEVDWLTQSQHGLEPIRAGRFHVHTPDHPPLHAAGVRDFEIPASQAFGTGQHATTAGCLTMLDHMKAQGLVVRNCADIGTGTGLLAFAALELWPRALATLSDIDQVCVDVVHDNAQRNHVPLGAGPGQVTMLVADGMDHPLLQARGPYDLVIANILAGPLIHLAPHFGKSLIPGGHLLLAGLLETQEAQVRRACRRAGLRLAARLVNGDWSILWLRKRLTK
ncbi:50S ribosomal protein L11 methyltransferase [Novosphingobium sp. B 225]|uniref:50S ribosomal protein L11 methyltransferase n=1 Tax=Novosphingobium sp. B 225 TaxID=1961849 RepID=UPI000B4AF1CB|nr:50S ribosomal protein L11 methyltransferase [Novosphingobium sp. B 225]